VGVSLKILPSLVKKNYKRKDAKSNTSNKPAKVANLHYTPEQISQLKSQMGISSMAQSINTLTGLMQTLVNSNKDSLTQSDNNNNVQQPVMSQGSKTVQPSVTVTRQVPRHMFSLDSNLDNSDVVDNFNLKIILMMILFLSLVQWVVV
jgi:hypothetical protein